MRNKTLLCFTNFIKFVKIIIFSDELLEIPIFNHFFNLIYKRLKMPKPNTITKYEFNF